MIDVRKARPEDAQHLGAVADPAPAGKAVKSTASPTRTRKGGHE